MTRSNQTRRPLLTAARLASAVGAVALFSGLFLALADPAQSSSRDLANLPCWLSALAEQQPCTGTRLHKTNQAEAC